MSSTRPVRGAAARSELIRRRLADERGRREKHAAHRIALAYPSPYRVAMSSLGYQRIYRALQDAPDLAAERVFLDDDADRAGATLAEEPVSYETLRPLGEFRVIAFSVAYELELAGLVKMLDAARVPLSPAARTEEHPLIVCGGPLTFSNPLPLGTLADAVILGEAETLAPLAMNLIFGASNRKAALRALADHPNIYVPLFHGDRLASLAVCDDALLPAYSAITTPHTELANMFLIESSRGCSRGCRYCVMRRSTNGGMRIVPMERLLETIPEDARRVGLVGAAVSDHPRIVELVEVLAARGSEVGLSSLRADKLKLPFVAALKRAGYRTLTTALDGASERMRGVIDRRSRTEHFEAVAEHARAVGMDRLKLYLMLGVPGEDATDVAECVELLTRLSRVLPVALAISAFCAKRNTPLDGQPFAGVDVIEGRLEQLRRGLRGRADVRAISVKWSWVEYVLAQGGLAEGRALIDAVHAGGRFSDYRRAFAALGHEPSGARRGLVVHRSALPE